MSLKELSSIRMVLSPLPLERNTDIQYWLVYETTGESSRLDRPYLSKPSPRAVIPYFDPSMMPTATPLQRLSALSRSSAMNSAFCSSVVS